MEEIIIRKYEPKDRAAVRAIACDTAYRGESCDIYFADREIFADFLTTYFTDYEPKSSFVCQIKDDVAGYLLGAKDSKVLTRRSLLGIFPRLFIRCIFRGTLLKPKNFIFINRIIASLIKGEFKTPNLYGSYPALLHINIKSGFRGIGIGSRLMAAYLNYLSSQKVCGVHLATVSDDAALFFQKQGFCLLHKGVRSYFRNILHKDVNCYIFGKKL